MSYVVRRSEQSYGSDFDIYELGETGTSSWVRICPERGGLVVSFAPGGRELLYLDEKTFAQKNGNVRGGIPVLWPICGQLPNNQYEWNETVYEMPQHGLARRLPWKVVEESTTNHAALTLQVTSTEETKREFPFDFELTFTYELVDGQLTIYQAYTNRTATPMPMYAGFHPYFLSTTKRLAYETDATTYHDFNRESEQLFMGVIDLEDKVESVVLEGATSGQIGFAVPEEVDAESQPMMDATELEAESQPLMDANGVVVPSVRIRMEYGSEFRHVVLWHVKDKPFVCVEPWMALPGALQTGKGLIMVEPHQSLETFLRIKLDV